MAPTPIPPIEWPTVTIGNVRLTVKFSFIAQYMLSKWGVDLAKVMEMMRAGREGGQAAMDPHLISGIVDLFAACVAHNYTEIGEQAKDGAYWAGRLDSESFKEVCRSIGEALGKALPAKPQAAPAPLATQEPTVQ